jgi:phage/plasmid-like protein (TIGR03299 family)
MADEISIRADGKAEMMYVGKMPWHGLGTKLDEPPTAEAAIQAAHLDWNVVKVQLYVGDEHRPLPGQYAIVREDRWNCNEDGLLGTVGHDYTPLQNADAFGFFDPIVKTGAASYESAGALKNGERVWVMARLKRDLEITRGDTIARYLLLSNTHDGTGSVQVKFTPVRVVCKNTLNEALSRGPAIRVAHTPNMPVRLEDAAGVVLAAIERHFNELGNRFRAMLTVQMLKPRLQEYLKAVFPDPSPGSDEKRYKRAVMQTERDRADSERLFGKGMGNDLAGVKDTLWAAYNGVTEYVDFHRGKFGDSKWLGDVWFGPSSVIKARALDEAIRLVPTD